MRMLRISIVASALLAAACGEDGDETGGASSPAGTGGSNGGAAGGGGAGGGAGSGGVPLPEPDPELLPAATGPCPDFTEGSVTFAPDGKSRAVQIWIGDAAAEKDGPLVFYWHGTGSLPAEAMVGLGAATIDAIKAEGGIVAAPSHDPASTPFPWFQIAGSGREDDQRVADEVLACAIEKVGVDVRRIHSSGMSAGGLQTVQFGYRRSGWIASVAPYSGGLIGFAPDEPDPDNRYAAMIFHGGASDIVVGVKFEDTSMTYAADLEKKGHFRLVCDHGGGHTIPSAQQSLWRFFQDHPYGTEPSPYAEGLPDGFPDYCSL